MQGFVDDSFDVIIFDEFELPNYPRSLYIVSFAGSFSCESTTETRKFFTLYM